MSNSDAGKIPEKEPGKKSPPTDPVGDLTPDEKRGTTGLKPQDQKNNPLKEPVEGKKRRG
ncbi:hypothetical protein [uncultured Parasphingopyxis sp.]|uniref:hypothetical protein n=1 Tax=uncultured Parasphingopyxis sp. TaxID=1547918 RepID=UPI00260AC245|nr:hypothetical protein [uncultured Parasphingopyxis sp.]